MFGFTRGNCVCVCVCACIHLQTTLRLWVGADVYRFLIKRRTVDMSSCRPACDCTALGNVTQTLPLVCQWRVWPNLVSSQWQLVDVRQYQNGTCSSSSTPVQFERCSAAEAVSAKRIVAHLHCPTNCINWQHSICLLNYNRSGIFHLLCPCDWQWLSITNLVLVFRRANPGLSNVNHRTNLELEQSIEGTDKASKHSTAPALLIVSSFSGRSLSTVLALATDTAGTTPRNSSPIKSSPFRYCLCA